MSLAELRLHHVRCLPAAELALHPRLNLITGPNGAGKTTLLEAVHLLGRGRSFRTRHTEQLIRREAGGMGETERIREAEGHRETEGHREAERLWVAGRVERGPVDALPGSELEVSSGASPGAGSRAVHSVDLQCDRHGGVVARIDARPVSSLSELSQVLPVQVIDPGIHRLIEEGPARRRRWLDWAVFHVEPGFLAQWQAYMRALRQRNAALRSGPQGDPLPWEPALARMGEALTEARARVLGAVQPYWVQALETLQAVAATLTFQPGWPGEVPLSQQLDRQRDRDRQRGHTGSGPHRCDVELSLGGRAVREVISRGQQKVLGAAMTLALVRYVATVTEGSPVLLLDDPAAELDGAHTDWLLRAVATLGGQCIVTTLEPASLGSCAPDRVFHVEHGAVKTL